LRIIALENFYEKKAFSLLNSIKLFDIKLQVRF